MRARRSRGRASVPPPAPRPTVPLRRAAPGGGRRASRAGALGGEPALDFGPVGGERRVGGRFEAEHQRRLRIRRAQQSPTLGERDTNAVAGGAALLVV